MINAKNEINARANARNVRPYYPYWQYTDLFIFRFVYIELTGHLTLLRHFGLFLAGKIEKGDWGGSLYKYSPRFVE